jgi:hypothetical protein
VAETRPVEGDEPVVRRVHDAAGEEVLDHAAVAVQQDDRRAGAHVEIAQPRVVYRDEMKGRRLVPRRQRRTAHPTHDCPPV